VVRFLSIYGLVAVFLRAATLVFSALVVGGIVYRVAVLRHYRNLQVQASCNRLLTMVCVALLFTQAVLLTVDSAVLMGTANLGLGDVLGANFALTALAAMIACVAILVLLRGQRTAAQTGQLLCAAVLVTAAVSTSHAASRVELRWLLSSLTALHMLAAFTWIGGLPYLLISIARSSGEDQARVWTRRFSRLAMISVAGLALSGVAMAKLYIDSPPALYGTAYGVMVAAKAALLVLLLLLGRLNYGLVQRFRTGVVATRLGRFVEVELGIGLTAILVAASLTSQPPAIDLKAGRVSAREIYARMRPGWPRLRSPAPAGLSPSSREQAKQSGTTQSFTPGAAVSHPNTAGDIAWSEYNHNWVGLLLLMMGVLAVVARAGHAKWPRYWPLLFLAMAFFILVRADPETWPLGPDGFWETFDNPETVMHRAAAVLIALFAIFEWRVQRQQALGQFAPYVFPAVCALGGALLLTHSHALGNIKEELLAELSHVPLALLGVVAGWSRWLELRLAPADRRIPAAIWPACFVVMGALLLNYREA
jgi:putative copper resistance protein D